MTVKLQTASGSELGANQGGITQVGKKTRVVLLF